MAHKIRTSSNIHRANRSTTTPRTTHQATRAHACRRVASASKMTVNAQPTQDSQPILNKQVDFQQAIKQVKQRNSIPGASDVVAPHSTKEVLNFGLIEANGRSAYSPALSSFKAWKSALPCHKDLVLTRLTSLTPDSAHSARPHFLASAPENALAHFQSLRKGSV